MAAALSHEFSHIIAGHHLKSRHPKWVEVCGSELLLFLALAPFAIVLASLFPSSAEKLLSKTRESDADDISVLLLMIDAGFNPKGALSLWTKYNKWKVEMENQRPDTKALHLREVFEGWIPFGLLHPIVSFHHLSPSTHPRIDVLFYSSGAMHIPEAAEIL